MDGKCDVRSIVLRTRPDNDMAFGAFNALRVSATAYNIALEKELVEFHDRYIK